MEDLGESLRWVSVPAFGEWEHEKNRQRYSFYFSRVREARRQNKARFTLFNVKKDDDFHGDRQQYHVSHQNDILDHHHARHCLQGLCRHCKLSYTSIKKIMRHFKHPKIQSFFHQPKIPSCFPRGS